VQISDYIYEKSQVIAPYSSLFINGFACLGKIESLHSKILGTEKNLGQSYGVQNFSLVTFKT
jgi:hypothetical protein